MSLWVGGAYLVEVNDLPSFGPPNAKVTHRAELGGPEQSEYGLTHQYLTRLCAMTQTRREYRRGAHELSSPADSSPGVYPERDRDLKIGVLNIVAPQGIRD